MLRTCLTFDVRVRVLLRKWGLGNFGTTGYPLQQGFDWFVGQDTQVGCHNWYPTSVCNNTVHEAPLNTPAELNFKSCLGPEQSCKHLSFAYVKRKFSFLYS